MKDEFKNPSDTANLNNTSVIGSPSSLPSSSLILHPSSFPVGVRFESGGRLYFFEAGGLDLKPGDWVQVAGPDGTKTGRIWLAPAVVEATHLNEQLGQVLGWAGEAEISQVVGVKERQQEALVIGQHLAQEQALPAKLLEVDYSPDGSKLSFYLDGPADLNWRDFARELAAIFRSRLEFYQLSLSPAQEWPVSQLELPLPSVGQRLADLPGYGEIADNTVGNAGLDRQEQAAARLLGEYDFKTQSFFEASDQR